MYAIQFPLIIICLNHVSILCFEISLNLQHILHENTLKLTLTKPYLTKLYNEIRVSIQSLRARHAHTHTHVNKQANS